MITINDRLIGSIDAVNVANDKEVIRLDFKCKNQVTELLKLTDCDAVYINYQNGSVKDRYLVTDLTADGEWVTFSWLLGKNATRAHGKTFFIVCAQITESDEIVQEWNTELAFFDVRKGLETVTAPSEPLEDIFTQLVEMINAKLEPSNIKAGQNVTVAVSGNDVTISATGGSGDAYTKAETDALLAEKQDKGDYATNTELGAEETARQNADNNLQLQINTKAQQRRTLYTPTAVSVVASSIADGVYEATAPFSLIINPDASGPETVSVNAGDLFYVKVASVSPYCRGFVLGDDMTIFTYPDSDEGVTISRITDYNSTFLGIFADLNNKADASALAAKQDLLVSGTNIKTLNGQSVLGSGNLAIESNERELFVDALPSTDIDENAAYYILNSKLFPDASGLVTTTYPCVLVTQVGNEWKLMATNSSTNFYAYTGTSPKSKTYQLYKVQDGEWVANGEATTGTGWATAMGIPAKNNVSAIKFANMNLKGESGLQTNYNTANNIADIYGNPVDSSQINPYSWLKYKHNGTAWTLIGECDFEELFDKVNAKVLADYATMAAMITALATKADKPASVTLTDESTVALADNTEYTGTGLTEITFTYPSGDFECYLSLSFAASGTITVTFPTSQYIGNVPTFENGKTYEVSIKNGVIVAGEVTSGA